MAWGNHALHWFEITRWGISSLCDFQDHFAKTCPHEDRLDGMAGLPIGATLAVALGCGDALEVVQIQAAQGRGKPCPYGVGVGESCPYMGVKLRGRVNPARTSVI